MDSSRLQECPFHSMEAHNHLWTMYHAEPDLWLLLVVGRGLVGPHCLASSLTGFLKGLHGVAVLLYGLISTRLQQDPSAQSVTNCLQPLLHEAGSSLVLTDQHHPAGLAMLSCPLGLTGGVPLLPISAAAFTSEWLDYKKHVNITHRVSFDVCSFLCAAFMQQVDVCFRSDHVTEPVAMAAVWL
eukprot:GHUV01013522.1.p1 GENE.GHUV01013522.1~~GHUV01013522.1.p1  ORF type:complete len:184 (+),score=31.52 GHUV01013522.1:1139-1690(+)